MTKKCTDVQLLMIVDAMLGSIMFYVFMSAITMRSSHTKDPLIFCCVTGKLRLLLLAVNILGERDQSNWWLP